MIQQHKRCLHLNLTLALSLEMSFDLVSKATRDGSGPPLPDSNSADSGTSASASSSSSDTQSKRHKPDRDERIAYLEGEIKKNTEDLRSLSKEIASVTNERAQLHRKEEVLSISENRRLGVIEKEDLPRMIQMEARLVAEIAEHKAELSRLKNLMELVDAPVSAQGMYVDKS